jgi:hypothetical protein
MRGIGRIKSEGERESSLGVDPPVTLRLTWAQSPKRQT